MTKSTKEIIDKILEITNLKVHEFAIYIGDNSAKRINTLIKNNCAIPDSLATLITNQFPYLSYEFISKGIGDPYIEDYANNGDELKEDFSNDGLILLSIVKKGNHILKQSLIDHISRQYNLDLYELYHVKTLHQDIKEAVEKIYKTEFKLQFFSESEELTSVESVVRQKRVLEFYNFLINTQMIKNKSDLAKQLGYGRTYVTEVLNGTNETTVEFETKLKNKYFEYWEHFISGTLPTNLGNDQNVEVIPIGKHSFPKHSIEGWRGLPMYNVPITASFIESFRDETDVEPQYYLYDPRFKDCDFGAIITGDSMHSEIRHGDFVACKEIVDSRFIVFGDIYYIVSTNGLETCKYINAGKDDDHLCLQAKNEKISPMQIPKEMVLKLYKVRGIVRGY